LTSARLLAHSWNNRHSRYQLFKGSSEVDKTAAHDQPIADAMARLADLREENAALRTAVKARDEFISIAAHELRNPMTPLLGQIGLLRISASRAGDSVPPAIARGIERLDVIVRRYMRRTTALLDIARLTSGNFQLNIGMVDVSAAVAEVVADFTSFAATAGSPLTILSEPCISGLFDRTALEEIAENLISNAIKYGRGQPIHVQLTASEREVCLCVEDHGLGISAENKERIFQQFERLMTGHSNTGFGLGLWVVGQLVDAMGGSIEIDGRPGQGSTFTVRLPLQKTMEKP
jgi:two-component system OmpR family sensor kinase